MSKNLRRAVILSLALMAGGFIGQAAQADPVGKTGSKDHSNPIVRAVQGEVGYATDAARATADDAGYFAQRTWDSCGACQGLSGGIKPPTPPNPAPVIPAPVQKILDGIER